MEKYYFIYALHTKEDYKKEYGSFYFVESKTENMQIVTDKHPLQYQIDYNKKAKENEISPSGDWKYIKEMKVISWQELTKEEFKKYK
jgi:hypothetical protein